MCLGRSKQAAPLFTHVYGSYTVLHDISLLASYIGNDMIFESGVVLMSSSADSWYSLLVPPVLDMTGNIIHVSFTYMMVKTPRETTLMLVCLAVREIVELASSAGTMLVYVTIWLTHREDFYLIDVVAKEELQRAVLVTVFDFAAEVVVLYITSRIYRRVWRVEIVQLASATFHALGFWRSQLAFVASTIFPFLVLQYNMGCDFSFKFIWLREGRDVLAGGEWCRDLQEAGSSCYAPDVYERLRELGYNVTADM